MARPALSDLALRSAPPLHRSLPTWAREPKENGGVQWRMYKRHRLGGALFIIFDAAPGMSRAAAATKLREFRRVLFGRDKHEAVEIPAPAAPPPTAALPCPAPQAEASLGQGSLF